MEVKLDRNVHEHDFTIFVHWHFDMTVNKICIIVMILSTFQVFTSGGTQIQHYLMI